MPQASLNQTERLLVGIETVYPSLELLLKRLKGQPVLRLYYGIDPTSPVLHLGHTVPLRLLKRFQEAGHHVILLIGDFTATVGDPSGRDSQRSVLSRAEVEANVVALKQQLFTVLDPVRTELRYNSEWYDDPAVMGSVRKLLELTHSFTAAQLWERDMFQRRQQQQQPVSLTEFFYPVLQAYDSVALDVDIEVGGTDQTFNMLAGRTLMRQMNQKEKFVITLPLILGTDGRKMSKSYGNTIGVNDEPNDMFGKLMSITDDQMLPYMTHLTDRFQTAGDEQQEFAAMITQRPRAAKALLAREVVGLYHGTVAATEAERVFDAQFRDHAQPENLLETTLERVTDYIDLLVQIGAASSRSEAKQLIDQGGLTSAGDRIDDGNAPVTYQPSTPFVVKVGKRRFYKVVITE